MFSVAQINAYYKKEQENHFNDKAIISILQDEEYDHKTIVSWVLKRMNKET